MQSKEYLYETHLHTFPVSKCARANVRKTVEFYKSLGYEGIFITNHFIDGNINIDNNASYEERIRFFFSDYKEGYRIGKELGLSVFCGIEMSYYGTDFLVYGLGEEWFLAHPEIEDMCKKEQLSLMAEHGALIIHAHPFREASYIDHIRLFPRHVHGIEVYNACRNDLENKMAAIYAENYGLLTFAGSDNHKGASQHKLGGMRSPHPITCETEFVAGVKNGTITPFKKDISDTSNKTI